MESVQREAEAPKKSASMQFYQCQNPHHANKVCTFVIFKTEEFSQPES
jgi:hypothetical protein